MSWWDAISNSFSTLLIGSRQKAVNDEVWKLKDEYKSEMKAVQEELKAVKVRLSAAEEGERECQRSYAKVMQQYRDVKEELIFLKRQKP